MQTNFTHHLPSIFGYCGENLKKNSIFNYGLTASYMIDRIAALPTIVCSNWPEKLK